MAILCFVSLTRYFRESIKTGTILAVRQCGWVLGILAHIQCALVLCSSSFGGKVDLMDMQYNIALFNGRECGTPLGYVTVERFKSSFPTMLSAMFASILVSIGS